MSDNTTISAVYQGPAHLNEDVAMALQVLSAQLSIDKSECDTHSVICVQKLSNEEALEATAIYLVSVISQNIDANLDIREALFGEDDMPRELLKDVISVIGAHNDEEDFNTMVRNPWMWEGISHMLIHLSRHDADFHPTGGILAKTSVKYDVHDHGLDLIAIYDAGDLGISAGECKAYFTNPSQGIIDAAKKLGEVDTNARDIEIRAVVSQLRSALDEDAKRKLAGTFWRAERSYLPFVCCDESNAPDWNRRRNSLRKLNISPSHKILVPISLSKARQKFNRICDVMRVYVADSE